MGFHKEENSWTFRRNIDHRVELEASNHGDAKEDENVQVVEASCYEMHHSSSQRVESPAQPFMHHREESPAYSFMNEDVVATNYNALVVYQAPEYRGEPLSIFKRRFFIV